MRLERALGRPGPGVSGDVDADGTRTGEPSPCPRGPRRAARTSTRLGAMLGARRSAPRHGRAMVAQVGRTLQGSPRSGARRAE